MLLVNLREILRQDHNNPCFTPILASTCSAKGWSGTPPVTYSDIQGNYMDRRLVGLISVLYSLRGDDSDECL